MAGHENRRPVPHAGLPQVAPSPGRVCGQCADAARLHHQRVEKTWQYSVDRLWSVPPVRLLPGPTAGTQRNLQHRRSHARTLRVRSRCGLRLKNLQAQPPLRNAGSSQLRHPGWLIFSSPLLFPGRSAALDVCVWPPLMQQHEETRRKRHLIANFPTTETKSLNSLPPCDLDGGRATAPSRHANVAVRRRHRFQSERAADIGESTPAQAEARSSTYSSEPESSHDTGSSAKLLGTG